MVMAAELALPWPAVLGHDEAATGSFSIRSVVALDADGAGQGAISTNCTTTWCHTAPLDSVDAAVAADAPNAAATTGSADAADQCRCQCYC